MIVCDLERIGGGQRERGLQPPEARLGRRQVLRLAEWTADSRGRHNGLGEGPRLLEPKVRFSKLMYTLYVL